MNIFFALHHITHSFIVQNFTALARTVASNWRVVDATTVSYCKSVAQLLKERHVELTKGGRSMKKTKKESTSRATKESTALSISVTETERVSYRHNPCSSTPSYKDTITSVGPMPITCSVVTPVASDPPIFDDNATVDLFQECAFVQPEWNCPPASMRTIDSDVLHWNEQSSQQQTTRFDIGQLENLPAKFLNSASDNLPVQVAFGNDSLINGDDESFEDFFGVDFEDGVGNF